MKTLRNFLKYHFRNQQNTQASYMQMRKDYISSKYNIINKVSAINGMLNPKYKIKSSEGILGSLTNRDVEKICNHLKEDGYFVFPNILTKNKVEELKKFAMHTPMRYLKLNGADAGFSEESVKYIDTKNISSRHQILDIKNFRNSETALDIVTDPNFLHIANNYLGAKPMLDLIVMWWSNSFKNIDIEESEKEILKDRSAQMFHFDMDRLKFLKFFIYLTDVDTDTGPHVYVRSSHNKIPPYIHKDGRYSDEHVNQHDKENIVEITGKAGSIIAVDTRGLHKGKELAHGERLIFQLEFTNSFFGKPETPEITEKFSYRANPNYFETYKYFYSQ